MGRRPRRTACSTPSAGSRSARISSSTSRASSVTRKCSSPRSRWSRTKRSSRRSKSSSKDPEGEAGLLYSAFGLPATYVIDRKGVVPCAHVRPGGLEQPRGEKSLQLAARREPHARVGARAAPSPEAGPVDSYLVFRARRLQQVRPHLALQVARRALGHVHEKPRDRRLAA